MHRLVRNAGRAQVQTTRSVAGGSRRFRGRSSPRAGRPAGLGRPSAPLPSGLFPSRLSPTSLAFLSPSPPPPLSQGASLVGGDIEEVGGDPCVVCPAHRYRISLTTGRKMERNLSGHVCPSAGKKQRTYATHPDGEYVWVSVPEHGHSEPLPSDVYNQRAIDGRGRGGGWCPLVPDAGADARDASSRPLEAPSAASPAFASPSPQALSTPGAGAFARFAAHAASAASMDVTPSQAPFAGASSPGLAPATPAESRGSFAAAPSPLSAAPAAHLATASPAPASASSRLGPAAPPAAPPMPLEPYAGVSLRPLVPSAEQMARSASRAAALEGSFASALDGAGGSPASLDPRARLLFPPREDEAMDTGDLAEAFDRRARELLAADDGASRSALAAGATPQALWQSLADGQSQSVASQDASQLSGQFSQLSRSSGQFSQLSQPSGQQPSHFSPSLFADGPHASAPSAVAQDPWWAHNGATMPPSAGRAARPDPPHVARRKRATAAIRARSYAPPTVGAAAGGGAAQRTLFQAWGGAGGKAEAGASKEGEAMQA